MFIIVYYYYYHYYYYHTPFIPCFTVTLVNKDWYIIREFIYQLSVNKRSSRQRRFQVVRVNLISGHDREPCHTWNDQRGRPNSRRVKLTNKAAAQQVNSSAFCSSESERSHATINTRRATAALRSSVGPRPRPLWLDALAAMHVGHVGWPHRRGLTDLALVIYRLSVILHKIIQPQAFVYRVNAVFCCCFVPL